MAVKELAPPQQGSGGIGCQARTYPVGPVGARSPEYQLAGARWRWRRGTADFCVYRTNVCVAGGCVAGGAMARAVGPALGEYEISVGPQRLVRKCSLGVRISIRPKSHERVVNTLDTSMQADLLARNILLQNGGINTNADQFRRSNDARVVEWRSILTPR